ncbi:E3 ubiquitin-protein ligase TRIM35-like isoform X2 [Pangasianodon hypophthalmus]|uniref:E3 ubiquitin-protein ligase TRIM35-like isoform X2 n=1 Tax=Pangasianodon hypophthalmus TaxID=310915 RepID=UPI0023076EDA|nr:E3 ubiquitin-protein ligase TRIM35-like isoform X2 [Pangasianodon hypophthalmus]
MDSQLPFSAEELSCPMCHNVFKDPVLLSCSHSICKVCFDQYWKCMGSLECPVCREQTDVASPCDYVSRDLCEVVLQRRRNEKVSACSTSLCGLHDEKFNLFCLEDEQLLCAACRTSETHENHKCCTIDIAAHDHKDLKTALRHLQDKCQVLKKVKSNYDQTAKYIKYQTKKTEQQIKKEFEKLHQFLQDEEASRLAALRQEEEQKSLMSKQKIEEINILIAYFSYILNMVKEEMGCENISFMQTLRAVAKGRAQCSLQEPQMFSGVLIDEAKHLGNLRFRVWEKMQEIVQYTSVILDPNTAHPELSLSDDLTSVQRSHGTQHLPNNPERFDQFYCVVGSEAFTSGIHGWDIEVTDVPDWEVGVTTAFIPRTGKTDLDIETWSVKASHGEYLARFSTAATFKLHLKESLRRIRVRLDWERGEVEFSNPVTDTYLFTFSHSFTEGVFPFFITPCKHSFLRILPLCIDFTVNTEQGLE